MIKLQTPSVTIGSISASSAVPQWRRAYNFAVLNAAVFLAFSAVNTVVGVAPITASVIAASVFAVGSLAVFINFIRNGGEVAAVSFFVLGTGIFFGAGMVISTVLNNGFQFLFTPDQQANLLPAVNLLNSVSVLVVLLFAWPLCRFGARKALGVAGLRSAVMQLLRISRPVLIAALIDTALRLATFPIPTSLLVRSFMTYADIFPILALLLIGMQWSELPPVQRVAPSVLFVLTVLVQILSLSKTAVLLPMAAFGGGLILDGRSRRLQIFYAISALLLYVFVIAPICNNGRNHPLYQPADNTISERIEIILDPQAGGQQSQASLGQMMFLLGRFSPAQIQAFLIDNYDKGAPGHSLSDAWAALVPRVVWPDKPNITRFGNELDLLFFQRDYSQSALAPTYSAEAYWNYGWLGVVVVSALMGLQIGWFTRKWHTFANAPQENIGILLFAIPITFTYVWVESWIAASYVGGFVTLLIMVKLADYAMVLLLSRNEGTVFNRFLSRGTRQ